MWYIFMCFCFVLCVFAFVDLLLFYYFIEADPERWAELQNGTTFMFCLNIA